MQLSNQGPAMIAAVSPPQKHRFNSGYPSPPSSGRTTSSDVEQSSILVSAPMHNVQSSNLNRIADECCYATRTEAAATTTAAIATTLTTTSNNNNIADDHYKSYQDRIDASITPPGTSSEEESEVEEEGEEGDEDAEGEVYEDEEEVSFDAATVEMNRSNSSSSSTWGESMPVSSPSTSITLHTRRESVEGGGQQVGSPYLDVDYNVHPIRDTPRNPFLQGGPADVGYSGPSKNSKKRREATHPPRERGRMTYVFRGQRVTYADPYASDSDDEEGVGPSTRGCMMDRLQPKLLFPNAGKAAAATSKPRGTTMDVFDGGAKKRSTVMAPPPQPISPFPRSNNRPTLDMAIERQNSRPTSGWKMMNSIDLLERLDRAGWSDSDEEAEEEDYEEYSRGSDRRRQQQRTYQPTYIEDDDYDEEMVSGDEEEAAEREENPFMQPTMNETSASFLHRLRQTQATTTIVTSQSNVGNGGAGAMRSNHSANRFNPYSQQSRNHSHFASAHAAMQ